MKYSFWTICAAFVALPVAASAQDIGLEYGAATGLGSRDVRVTAVSIINVALGLLGIIFVSLIIKAGFQWMTSQGNSEAIDKAKGTIQAAAIGLGVVLAAFAITQFVSGALFEATTGVPYRY
ncbi:MAG: hypothetical protein HOE53_00720 [Candidatus Magasanikbacteria bacterium]|jgi:hypothetical protein|nr:hypothetical protein [Candidatus Magasanikbacteria bacterium]